MKTVDTLRIATTITSRAATTNVKKCPVFGFNYFFFFASGDSIEECIKLPFEASISYNLFQAGSYHRCNWTGDVVAPFGFQHFTSFIFGSG